MKSEKIGKNSDPCKEYGSQLKTCLNWNVTLIIVISSLISNTNIIYLNNRYEQQYINIEQAEFEAIIVSDKKTKPYYDEYKIRVKSIDKNNKNYQNSYLILKVKNKNIEFEYGDKIRFQGRYEAPLKQRNYKGFDDSKYLKTLKISGRVTLLGNATILQKDQLGPLLKLVHRSRQTIQKQITIFPEETRYLLLGILLGQTDKMDKQVSKIFKDSNLSHLLAVSGMHVSYIIAGIIIVFKRLKIGNKLRKIATMIFLVFFMFLVGLTPSVVRACMMVILTLIASILQKKPDTINNMAIVLFVLLLDNPYLISSLGVILSFGGTIGIIVFNKTFQTIVKTDKFQTSKKIKDKIINNIKALLSVTISAQIILFPILWLHFGTVSATFFISNLLASPLLGLIIIFGFISISLSLFSKLIAIPSIFITNILLTVLLKIAEICSSLPLSKVYLPIPNIIDIILYYVMLAIGYWTYQNRKDRRVIVLLKKIMQYKKVMLGIVLFVIVMSQIWNLFPQDLMIYFVDVGQGDCSLIVSPYRKTILVDGGGSMKQEEFDVGQRVVLPYVLNRGIGTIDYLMISHFDSDHCRPGCLL